MLKWRLIFLDNFGCAVAVGQNMIAIGVQAVLQQGAVDIYVVQNGSRYIWQQRLWGTNQTGAYFGSSLSISQNVMAVGEPQYGNGSVYIFVQNGNVWTQQVHLFPNSPTGGDAFGTALSIQQNTLAIISPYTTPNGGVNAQGVTYVYTQSANVWTFQQALTGDIQPSSGMTSVSVGASTLVFGTIQEVDNPHLHFSNLITF